jgi:large subunit ribosomal protein L10Ae
MTKQKLIIFFLFRFAKAILKGSQEKKRKFTETVELQIGLKNYDPQKDKRFTGAIKLPHPTKPKFSVMIFGDQAHIDQATALNLPVLDVEALKKFKKAKKPVKQLCKAHNAFLASETLLRQIPRLLGPTPNKLGKFPALIAHTDDLNKKIFDLSCTVKFQLKKVLCIGVAVGHVKLTEDQLIENLTIAINFLVSLLKKHWQNVKSLTIKTTQGKPVRVF